jgi:uncharacterized protein (DUF1330 family)
MTAYIIANVEIIDQAAYDEYRKGVPATVAAYGGRFLARGGATRVFEGDFLPKRFVIIEFPDTAAAQRWYESPEYRPLLEIRKRASRGSLFIVEGV